MKNFAISLFAFLPLLTACSSRQLDNIESENLFDDWGVTSSSYLFGSTPEKKYYIINPTGMVADSLYFNANYTDSYFAADSTRIVMQYIPDDSIYFHLDRLYAVEVNPMRLIARVVAEGDTAKDSRCELELTKIGNGDCLFGCWQDTLFTKILKLEKILDIHITNTPQESKSEGTQNYRYKLYCNGFNKALARCVDLNAPPIPKDSTKTESEDNKTAKRLHK